MKTRILFTDEPNSRRYEMTNKQYEKDLDVMFGVGILTCLVLSWLVKRIR